MQCGSGTGKTWFRQRWLQIQWVVNQSTTTQMCDYYDILVCCHTMWTRSARDHAHDSTPYCMQNENHSVTEMDGLDDAITSLDVTSSLLAEQFTISRYLAAMVLANSCEIEQNLGPPAKFPCGVWAKAVKLTDHGICCDRTLPKVVSYKLWRNVKQYLWDRWCLQL